MVLQWLLRQQCPSCDSLANLILLELLNLPCSPYRPLVQDMSWTDCLVAVSCRAGRWVSAIEERAWEYKVILRIQGGILIIAVTPSRQLIFSRTFQLAEYRHTFCACAMNSLQWQKQYHLPLSCHCATPLTQRVCSMLQYHCSVGYGHRWICLFQIGD